MQTDWIAFQRQRQQDSVDRLLDFFQSRMFSTLSLGRAILDLSLGFYWYRLFFGSITAFMLWIRLLSHVFGPMAKRFVRKHPITVGTGFQVSILISWSTVCLVCAVCLPAVSGAHPLLLALAWSVLLSDCTLALLILLPWWRLRALSGSWPLPSWDSLLALPSLRSCPSCRICRNL